MTDFDRAFNFISSQKWIFAKTMAYIPHWYCLRSDFKNIPEFAWFVNFMRNESVDGRFGNRTFKYFYLNGSVS